MDTLQLYVMMIGLNREDIKPFFKELLAVEPLEWVVPANEVITLYQEEFLPHPCKMYDDAIKSQKESDLSVSDWYDGGAYYGFLLTFCNLSKEKAARLTRERFGIPFV